MAIHALKWGRAAAACALLVAAGCGGGSSGTPGAAGSGGSTGSAGTTGAAGSGSTGSAGTTGGAGSGSTGSAGTTGGAGSGSTGSAGTTAGTGSSSDGGAGTGDAGAPDGGGDASGTKRHWTCPAGPFEAPKAGQAQNICPGFKVKYGWSEGPTWIASQNAFFYSNFVINASGPGDMIKYTPSTNTCEFFIEGNGCNGLGVGVNGNIIAACHTPRAIMEYDPVTKQGKKLADMAENKLLDSPNDLVARTDGMIFFTNPTYELGGRPQGLGNALVKLTPTGVTTVLMRGGINGIALSPDEKKLYVVQMGVFDLDAQGNISNQKNLSLGGDGIAVDCAGNIYDSGGTIRNPAGQNLGNFPGGTNMAFGGPDMKTLLVVRNQQAQVVQMNIAGIP